MNLDLSDDGLKREAMRLCAEWTLGLPAQPGQALVERVDDLARAVRDATRAECAKRLLTWGELGPESLITASDAADLVALTEIRRS